MSLPRVLKMQKIYSKARSLLGTLAQVTLPDLETETEDHTTPIGKFSIDVGFKQPVIKFKVRGGDNIMRRALYNPSITAEGLYWVGSYQNPDGTTSTGEFEASGTTKKNGRGDQENNKISEEDIEFAPTIYQERVDGIEVLYVNYLTNELRIDGVDVMAAHRDNVG